MEPIRPPPSSFIRWLCEQSLSFQVCSSRWPYRDRTKRKAVVPREPRGKLWSRVCGPRNTASRSLRGPISWGESKDMRVANRWTITKAPRDAWWWVQVTSSGRLPCVHCLPVPLRRQRRRRLEAGLPKASWPAGYRCCARNCKVRPCARAAARWLYILLRPQQLKPWSVSA